MSPVESPFAVRCDATSAAVAVTPFAMEPPNRSPLLESPPDRPRSLAPGNADRTPHAVLSELDDLLVTSGARALLIKDFDLLVHVDDIERFVDRLSANGFGVDRAELHGGYTTVHHGVSIELVVSAPGHVGVDDEMLDRGEAHEDDNLALRVAAPEDRIVIDALATSKLSPHHWYDALALIARCDLDWDYLTARARRSGPRRVISLLLYAASIDLAVPANVVEQLFDTVHPHRDRTDH